MSETAQIQRELEKARLRHNKRRVNETEEEKELRLTKRRKLVNNESEERRLLRLARKNELQKLARANESPDKRRSRLDKQKEYKREIVANESLAEKILRQAKDAECHFQKRANESQVERNFRLAKDAERHSLKRANESLAEKILRQAKDAECHSQKRANESLAERNFRLTKDAERHSKKKANESPTERNFRLAKDAERHSLKRANESLAEKIFRQVKDAERHSLKRTNESPSERRFRLELQKEYKHQVQANESLAERSFFLDLEKGYVQVLTNKSSAEKRSIPETSCQYVSDLANLRDCYSQCTASAEEFIQTINTHCDKFCDTCTKPCYSSQAFKMGELSLVSSNACFGGFQKVYSHNSEELKCKMNFAIYLPPQAETGDSLPVIYWLSGLTCTEQNFITKAGAQRYASEHGIVIVCPDTSPRNLNIPGEDDSYDFGSGAGFYVDATQEPWKKNYRMFSYVTVELVNLIAKEFGNLIDVTKQGIMGHSMGGHGALICALKNPGLYRSVSAFAPICNPIECPWGVKAFTGYLGPKESGQWNEWDAVELVKSYNGPPLSFLIHQGKEDNFYKEKQLLPENLMKSCQENAFPCILKMNEDYDHSYYFIASFIGEHIAHHATILKASN